MRWVTISGDTMLEKICLISCRRLPLFAPAQHDAAKVQRAHN